MGVHKDAFELGLFMTGLIWRPVPSRNEHARFRGIVDVLARKLDLAVASINELLLKTPPKGLIPLFQHVDDQTKAVNDTIRFPLKQVHGGFADDCFQLGRSLSNIAGALPFLADMRPFPSPDEMSGFLSNFSATLTASSKALGIEKFAAKFIVRIEKGRKYPMTREQMLDLASSAMKLAETLSPWIELHLDAAISDYSLKPEPRRLRLWAVGSFWLLVFTIVFGATLILVRSELGFAKVIIALMGMEVLLLLIGALALRSTGDLSEKSFLNLVSLALRSQFRLLSSKRHRTITSQQAEQRD